MTDPTQSSEPGEEHLNELIAEYLRRVDGGEELDPDEFIAPHPEAAESFRQYLEDAAFVDGLKESRAARGEGPSAGRDTAGSPAVEETIPPSYVSLGRRPTPEVREFGRYRLVRLLGQGAMGAVYLAEDPELQRQVALKIPKFLEDEDAKSRERFYREARAAATLNHPSICQVHDIGEQDGTPFIAMAYVRGKPLSQFVAKRQWPERDVAKLLRKIALALDEAHAQGIVHRDLKPTNIMLDQRHEPIVMDFGLAGRVSRPGEEKLTHARALLGTPAYMSPEQARGDMAQVGPPSDVYSLGVICYELLVGEVPFRGPVGAVIGQIVRDEPRPPSEIRPTLDKRMEAICLKMMAKAPEDRYGSAGEVAAALRQFLEETAPAVQSSQHAAAEAALELEARKQEIVRRLQAGQFGPAIDALDKLAGVEGPGAGEYAAWALAELARVRALPRELLEKGPAVVETAIELIASQEYAEAARILGAVPEEYRSPEAVKLLEKATKLQQEAEQLNARMHEAVHKQQYDGLQDDLSRLLELQPGNLTARELYDRLSTYAPGRPYRFDKDGKLLPAHRTPLLVLLGNTLRQSLRGYARRQKYRDAAGRRIPAPAEPAPAARRSPIVPVAIVLLVFALVALGIVVLLRDGRQTVRVQIDEAVLADTSMTLHIDGNRMEIAGLGETIKLAPGEHGYELRRGDQIVRFERFTVLKGDNPALEISFGEGPLVDRAETPRAADQPPLAAAPFDEAQAKAHQKAWADYLGVPVEKTNSIGMKLVLIPPGEFLMGSTAEEQARFLEDAQAGGEPWILTEKQHRVRITRPFYLGKHEVTRGQFRQFVKETGYRTEAEQDGKGGSGSVDGEWVWVQDPRFVWNTDPGFEQTDDHPVVNVSWNDATAFCQWLSDKEGADYLLPNETQWEYGCRAGTTTSWHCGDTDTALEEYAWYSANSGGKTHPVGQLKPNGFGLYDMLGNVREWCVDESATDYRAPSPPNDPSGPPTPSYSLHRGGGWHCSAGHCRSAIRLNDSPGNRSHKRGFRVIREIEGKADRRTQQSDASQAPRAAEAPPLAAAPFNSTEAKQYQREWAAYLGVPVETTNSIGMKLILIPPGEFDMGSTQEEIDQFLSADENRELGEVYTNTIRAEAPRHRVRITRPFYLGTYEVTQAEYQRVMGVNPSGLKAGGKDAPVEQVSWSDALEFCRNLSDLSEEMAAGREYRLPTDAEWEYACRAGTVSAWHCGDSNTTLQEYAWFNVNAGGTTHPVGRLKPNAWGLYDMHGNVWELCADWYSADYYAQSPPNDPRGPSEGSFRVHRGGTWQNPERDCRSAHRNCDPPDVRYPNLGFRVVCEIEAAPERRTALPATLPETTVPAAPNAPFDEARAKAHQKAWADYLGVPVEITNSIDMKLVLVPPGEFDMGSTQEEIDQLSAEAGELLKKAESDTDRQYWHACLGRLPHEGPRHRVEITEPFYLGMYEVTGTEYEQVMGTDPSLFRAAGGAGPVGHVFWSEAQAFCRTLSELPQEKAAGRVYHLPTEAQWEYACRAGTTTRYFFGNDEPLLGDYAWSRLNAGGTMHPVGHKRPNAWGLYDMLGNMREMCADPYGPQYYEQSPHKDPSGPPSGAGRAARGGCVFDVLHMLRSAARHACNEDDRYGNRGFRAAMTFRK